MDGCRQISPGSLQAGVGCDRAHRGVSSPLQQEALVRCTKGSSWSAGGFHLCHAAVLHGSKQALVSFAAALGSVQSNPRWSISTGTSGLGLTLTCSVAPQDEGNQVAQSHQLAVPQELRLRHLIRQERGKDGQRTPSWTWGKKRCKPEWRGEQEGGCTCPWNLHNPATAWCLNEREKGKEKFVNYP